MPEYNYTCPKCGDSFVAKRQLKVILCWECKRTQKCATPECTRMRHSLTHKYCSVCRRKRREQERKQAELEGREPKGTHKRKGKADDSDMPTTPMIHWDWDAIRAYNEGS